MSQDDVKCIGLIVGREQDWPDAFMTAINRCDEGITAEFVKLGGTLMEDVCPYAVIIDRMSHQIPYYRAYVKYAAMHGSYIINDPFVWSADSRFFGTALAQKLGLKCPRTVVLPNKDVESEVGPDGFRNLVYPMDWKGIIDYVGVPAVFKEVRSGGRRLTFRVHSVDELIQRYDESGTRTMMLQQLIEGGEHIHCFVIGREQVLSLRFSREENRYYEDTAVADDAIHQKAIRCARALTRAYGYDINMVEFILGDDDLYTINATNPTPVINRELMTETQFQWLVDKTVELGIARAKRPLPQRLTFHPDSD